MSGRRIATGGRSGHWEHASADRGGPTLPPWAASHFELALPPVLEMTSPRTWAFSLLGISEYLRRFGGDRVAASDPRRADGPAGRPLRPDRDSRLALVRGDRLLRQRPAPAGPDRQWAQDGNDPRRWRSVSHSLSWLVKVQTRPQGHFRAIGCHGFLSQRGEPGPVRSAAVEAHATCPACLEAYRATQDARWMHEARSAFEWFLGRNDLGQELYDPTTGGCCDGLQEDRVNRNQGPNRPWPSCSRSPR